jgi:hypothetical protein
VEVHRLSRGRDFFVLSVRDIPEAKSGSVLLLSHGGQPVVEVELGTIYSSGLAMAYVTRILKDLSTVQEGNLFSAKALVKTSSEFTTDEP